MILYSYFNGTTWSDPEEVSDSILGYYYRYPSNLKEGEYIKTAGNSIFPKVDVRGDKGLIVVPPSIHKSGNKYIWNIAEGFYLSDISELPECPINIPKILGNRNNIQRDKKDSNENYNPGKVINIAKKCAWLRHCKDDAATLGYDEWLWMLSIVARCENGREKAHKLSNPHPEYSWK